MAEDKSGSRQTDKAETSSTSDVAGEDAKRDENTAAEPGESGDTDGDDKKKGKGPKVFADGEVAPKIVVRPMAGRAKRKRRHATVFVSFFFMVLIPVSALAWYMSVRAVDQYASNVGFTVRQEDGGGSPNLLGGLAAFTGGSGSSGASDSDILYEFIQSQRLVSQVNDKLDLWAHYGKPYKQDPYFGLKPGGTIEDLHSYWTSVVSVNYDSGTGLLGLEVRAFDPEFAKTLAQQILDESQDLVNDLNATARGDMLKAAEEDVRESLTRLKSARQALVKFRTRTQIVDPESDMQTRMGVQNSLQQQLAQALIEHDLLAQSASADDPRVVQARRRIEVIRGRLSEERKSFASEEEVDGVEGYPTLIAEYESLAVDREFSEQTYRAALAALDGAKANATRQSRYLAAFILPTLPETAEYPKRRQTTLIGLLFLILGWGMFNLVYYSIRDRN